MTKADVIGEVFRKTGIEKVDISHSLETFFTVIKESMEEGNNIYIRGFGSFVNKKRRQKIARNISRNTSMVIAEHYIPSFKPSKRFSNKIRNSEKVKRVNNK